MSPFAQGNNPKATILATHKATSTKAEKAHRSVQFSSKVSLRIVSLPANPNNFVSWHSEPEIISMKRHAKSLAKLHYRLFKNSLTYRASPSNSSDSDFEASEASDTGMSSLPHAPKYAHPTGYEIMGESLRGMEYITDFADGRRRRGVRISAISAVVNAQDHCLSSQEIACRYGKQAQVAMEYSKRVAEQDSLEAARILLSQDCSEPLRVSIVEYQPEPIRCKHRIIGSQYVRQGLCWNCWHDIDPTQSELHLLAETITFNHTV